MAIVIQNHVIWLEISVDDISFVQVMQCQQYFSNIQSSSVFSEPSFVGNDLSQITSRTELKNQEKLSFRLEGIVQVHDEWMPHVRKHVTLSLGISDKILSQYLPLAKSFHCIQLARVFVSNQEDITETATS